MVKPLLYLLLLLIPLANKAGSGNLLPAMDKHVDLYTELNLFQ